MLKVRFTYMKGLTLILKIERHTYVSSVYFYHKTGKTPVAVAAPSSGQYLLTRDQWLIDLKSTTRSVYSNMFLLITVAPL